MLDGIAPPYIWLVGTGLIQKMTEKQVRTAFNLRIKPTFFKE
jgi:hypothetical protein